VEINQQLAEAHAEMAMLYAELAQVWLQLDKKPEAIASLEKAIALELKLEDSEELYHKPEVWVKAGDNLANAERWDEAIVHYQRAIEIEPTYHQSYQNLGIALAKVGKIEDAIASYSQVLETKLNAKPLVSVGIPTYNRAHLIKRSITSVINQDYDNIEIVISDNASTDATPLICQEFCEQYERIKYIRQHTNYGPTRNFREALENSDGEFFMWLADDDYLDYSYISNCVNFLQENPDYSLACGRRLYFKEDNKQDLGEREFIYEGQTSQFFQEKATERVKAYYQNVGDNGFMYGLYRRHQLLGVPMNHTMGGDWLFIASIAFLGKVKTLENVSIKRSGYC
jgi:glycosyltransferase domain-containing protein